MAKVPNSYIRLGDIFPIEGDFMLKAGNPYVIFGRIGTFVVLSHG